MFEISVEPLDIQAYQRAVSHPSCGAELLFLGAVRDNFAARPVTALEYQAYPALAIPVMQQMVADMQAIVPGARAAIGHRTGRLELGEVSLVVAVSTPHRGECYKASRFLIEALKERLPVWKKEIFADGDAHWKPNDPDALSGPAPERRSSQVGRQAL